MYMHNKVQGPYSQKIANVNWLLIVFGIITSSSRVTAKPWRGIIAETSPQSFKPYSDSYIFTASVKWAESGGSRVIPILLNKTDNYYEQVFSFINGAIFPGGAENLLSSPYSRAARKIYQLAIKAKRRGDYFPIFSICLGFQELTALTCGKNLLTDRYSTESLPLNMTSEIKKSRLFGNLPENIIGPLTTANVTANFHNYGLTLQNFTQNEKLKSFFRVLSTNQDMFGREFISTIEAIDYPFYGTQWHPEKNMFKWTLLQNISHSYDAVRVMQYFADFFINECRKNGHSFPNLQVEIDHLIDNYPVVFIKNKTMDTFYAFKNSD